VKEKINTVLKKNEFESTRLLSGGNWNFLIRIDQKFVNGKINWRRWVPRANLFFNEVLGYLDDISSFLELSGLIDEREMDEYGKFCYYADLAFRKGLINQSERKKIENESIGVFR